jgi:hypothetical protein
MKQPRTQFGIMFLLGFAASAISGGAPMVLLILMATAVAAALVLMHFEPEIKLPTPTLSRYWKHDEKSVPQSALVLGVGHQVRR